MKAQLQHWLNKALVGLVTLVTGYAGTQFSKLVDAVGELGRQVAVTSTQTLDDRARLDSHDARLDSFDERLSHVEAARSNQPSRTQDESSPTFPPSDYTRSKNNKSKR